MSDRTSAEEGCNGQCVPEIDAELRESSQRDGSPSAGAPASTDAHANLDAIQLAVSRD
jgi:hypothetical protein